MLKLLRFAILPVLAISLVGCKGEDSEIDTSVNETKSNTTASLPAGTTIYANAMGVAVCPIMKDEIADITKASGHYDYKGKRYYMCCPPCLEKVEKDPTILDNIAAL